MDESDETVRFVDTDESRSQVPQHSQAEQEMSARSQAIPDGRATTVFRHPPVSGSLLHHQIKNLHFQFQFCQR